MTDNRKCLSINSFKVIVNRKNNVPFHFEEFYNDHVHFVILLQKKRKEIMSSESMASREINKTQKYFFLQTFKCIHFTLQSLYLFGRIFGASFSLDMQTQQSKNHAGGKKQTQKHKSHRIELPARNSTTVCRSYRSTKIKSDRRSA